MSLVAPTLEAFFTDRLIRQQAASLHTIASYRDTFCLLLRYLQTHTAKAPCALDFADLDAPVIGAFLDHLEADRHCSVSTRNVRLAAIRSLFRYAALRHPEHAASISRVLAMPNKRHDRALVNFLTEDETAALVAAPDTTGWLGRRDRCLLLVATQCGLRVSELTGLRCGDLKLGTGAHLRCRGKGRKERVTPLAPATSRVLAAWAVERAGQPGDPLLPTRQGRQLSTDAVAKLLSKHLAVAAAACASLRDKRVSPHTLRHTAAMTLLRSGVDITVIALWLGHEQIETTQIYLHADMTIKERALALTKPPGVKPGRYRAPDPLLAFLDSL